MAKASFETSVTVNAPVETVYNYLADFPRHVEWNHQPQEMVSLTEGPVRVGSQFKTKEAMPSNAPIMQKVMFTVMTPVANFMYGSTGHTVAEITALEPNRRVGWKAHLPSTKKGDLMRMNWELRLQPQNGATEVTQRCEVDPPDESPFAGMVNDDLARQSQAETAANLARLKSILEG